MSVELVELFPTVVLRNRLERSFTVEELAFVKDRSKYVKKSNFPIQQSIDTEVLNDPVMASIKEFAIANIQRYAASHNIIDSEIYITQSWLNLHTNREPHPVHLHPNSFLSGVIYFTDGTPIEFDRTSPGLTKNDFYSVNISKANEYNSTSNSLSVRSGNILIFPSYLPHRVTAVPSNLERISLAFNTYFKGTVGRETDLTLLKL
jgi:uncharacterized protein (TIGR02466 family)